MSNFYRQFVLAIHAGQLIIRKRQLLKDINVHFEEGKVYNLVGANSSEKIRLSLLLSLTISLVGCTSVDSTSKNSMKVPSYSTVDEYMSWAEENKVYIRWSDSEGVVVDDEDKGTILEVIAENIAVGETIDIIVCRSNKTYKLIIKNDPMESLNRK